MKENTEKGGRKAVIAAITGVVALVLLVAGLVRHRAVTEKLNRLPEEQTALEELGELAAEYRQGRMGQVDPGDKGLVRALMQETAEKHNFGKSLVRTGETKVNETKTYVETKYTAELKDVTLRNCVEFLYDIQYSGKDLTPAELHLKRQKEEGKWNASLAVYAFSVLE